MNLYKINYGNDAIKYVVAGDFVSAHNIFKTEYTTAIINSITCIGVNVIMEE